MTTPALSPGNTLTLHPQTPCMSIKDPSHTPALHHTPTLQHTHTHTPYNTSPALHHPSQSPTLGGASCGTGCPSSKSEQFLHIYSCCPALGISSSSASKGETPLPMPFCAPCVRDTQLPLLTVHIHHPLVNCSTHSGHTPTYNGHCTVMECLPCSLFEKGYI